MSKHLTSVRWLTGPASVIVPLVLVNGISITGQAIYWRAHLPGFPAFAAVGFAVALESIAIFLAHHAALAERANDSALKLRLASYAFGLAIGVLNGSHWTSHGHLTAASAGMFLLSSSSPWLWAVTARRAARDELKANGMIDGRSVRLGQRWLFWFRQTFGVYRLAIWTGETNTRAAIARWESDDAARRAVREAEKIARQSELTLESATNQADAIRVAVRELGENAANSEVVSYLAGAAPKPWKVTAQRVRAVRATMGTRQP